MTGTNKETSVMDPEFKAALLADLRSGVIPQTHGKLRDGDARCCLGVACDVAIRMGVEVESRYVEFSGTHYYDNEMSVLPDSVIDFAGFGEPNPEFQPHRLALWGQDEHYLWEQNGNHFWDETESLASLNDEGFTFSQLADIIDYFF